MVCGWSRPITRISAAQESSILILSKPSASSLIQRTQPTNSYIGTSSAASSFSIIVLYLWLNDAPLQAVFVSSQAFFFLSLLQAFPFSFHPPLFFYRPPSTLPNRSFSFFVTSTIFFNFISLAFSFFFRPQIISPQRIWRLYLPSWFLFFFPLSLIFLHARLLIELCGFLLFFPQFL